MKKFKEELQKALSEGNAAKVMAMIRHELGGEKYKKFCKEVEHFLVSQSFLSQFRRAETTYKVGSIMSDGKVVWE